MIELFDDFRDILVSSTMRGLASSCWAVTRSHSMGTRVLPRISMFWWRRIRTMPSAYTPLAAFGAPLSAFDVGVEDFASYDGVLQLGVPPRRIDIINRADGITFADAIADGESFNLEGCKMPVIGRGALIKNKRAAGRPQDIADVKALGDG
jgi:hypothetical protein